VTVSLRRKDKREEPGKRQRKIECTEMPNRKTGTKRSRAQLKEVMPIGEEVLGKDQE